MRAYFFGNMYISSIGQGIQAGHVLAELFVKYQQHSAWAVVTIPTQHLYDWAHNHKTMILLNGGYSEALRSISELFAAKENPYPWSVFHEGQDALDGALTCVGIILPEKIYGAGVELVTKIKSGDPSATLGGQWQQNIKRELYELNLSPYEQALCEEISKYGLAR